MKRTLMTLALCLALASGSAVYAAPQHCAKDGKEQCHKGDGKGKKGKKGKKGGHRGPNGEFCGKDKKGCPEAGDSRGFQCFFPGPNGEVPCKQGPECEVCKNAFEGIDLSADQVAKVKELKKKKAEKMGKERGKIAEKRAKLRKEAAEKRAKMQSDYDKDLSKVLTPSQMAQYKQNKSKIEERRKARREECRGKGQKCNGIDKSKFKENKLREKSGGKEIVPAPQPMPLTGVDE